MDFDVVVCGYGPTGAVAANLLGQRGVRTLVIDRSEEIYDIPRAVHFDGETMRIFQSIDLADEVKAMSGTAEALAFVNGRGRTLISAHAKDFAPRHGWPTGNFFNQPRLEAQLRAGAARFPSVEVRLGSELESFEQDDLSVRVGIRRTGYGAPETVSARYLLGCDGATSPVREIAGLPLEDLDCDEPWLVCDMILDEGIEYRSTIYQFCDPRRPATLVPCEGRHIRWEFMLMPGDDPDELEREENVRALMAPYLPLLNDDLRPDQGRLIRSKVYRFHGLVAERFCAGRAFVLGDAAHQTPPFLGQGLCAGVRDAYNLCWKLHGVLAGCLAPELLESYTTERRPHARAVVAQAIRTGRVIQTRSRPRALLRDAFFALSRVIPALRKPFMWEPAWTLGPGLFDVDGRPPRDGAVGNPIDQPVVETAVGEQVRLDAMLGRSFAVVGFDVDPARVVDLSAARVFADLDTRYLQVVSRGGAARGDDTVVDVEGGLATWRERVGGGRVAVLRPDRQVFGLYDGTDEDALRGAITEAAARLGAAARVK